MSEISEYMKRQLEDEDETTSEAGSPKIWC